MEKLEAEMTLCEIPQRIGRSLSLNRDVGIAGQVISFCSMKFY